MKYKYPKHITIGNIKFRIIYEQQKRGARFIFPTDTEKAEIIFGMKDCKNNKLEFLDMVIHELKEIIQIGQYARLYNPGLSSYDFHYNHASHDDLCTRLSGHISKFIK